MSYFCEISYDDLEFFEGCGGGSFGCVYRARWKSKNCQVAVKKLLALETEVQILSQLSHRNIVQFYGAVTVAPNFCIVTEYAEKGSLYDYLHRQKGLTGMLDFQQILCWAREIAQGMHYLHSEAPVTVIHRDLKSKNVVINANDVCKICDFGVSKFMSGTTRMTFAGTFAWMAPEVIQSLPVSQACDVWSYGVVLWELLTHEMPFSGFDGFQVMWLVAENGERLTIPNSCPEKFAELLRDCWCLKPQQRPSFHSILGRLDQMSSDRNLPEETDSFIGRRAVWKQEIETWLERLKKTANNLGIKEDDLRRREALLREKERQLENKFHVVQLESYDVNTWRDVDVHQWIQQLGHSGCDLAQFADLFARNAITGKRLLLLTQDNLRSMGITSEGHIVELNKEIQNLKRHNYRLQNFPPLNAALPPTLPSDTYVQLVTLIIGCHFSNGLTLQDSKWKMYFDLDAEDETLALKFIKHVTFVVADQTIKLTHPPFVMDRWMKGINGELIVQCIVQFEDDIRKPRNSKLSHRVEACNTQAVTQTTVSLTVQHVVSPSSNGGCRTPPGLIHSQSSPMLSGAWNNRNLEHAVPPIDSRRYQASVWSRVVSGSELGQQPAYNPTFIPVPPLPPSVYSANRRASTPPRHLSSRVSSTSSSIHSSYSRDSIHGDLDLLRDSRRPSQNSRNSVTEPTNLTRLESRESGVFMTPSPAPQPSAEPSFPMNDADMARSFESSSDGTLHFDSHHSPSSQSSELLTVKSLANLGRYLMGQNGADQGTNFNGDSRRGSSPIAWQNAPHDDVLESSHVRSNSLRISRTQRNSLPVAVPSTDNSGLQNMIADGIQAMTLAAGRTSLAGDTPQAATPKKSKRKPKNKLRNQSRTSMEVHGGNAKWRWNIK